MEPTSNLLATRNPGPEAVRLLVPGLLILAALCMPALLRPVLPALCLLVLVPGVLAWALGNGFGRVLPAGLAAGLAVLAMGAPFFGAAASEMSRLPWLGLVALLLLPLLALRGFPRSLARVGAVLAMVAFVWGPRGDLLSDQPAVPPLFVFGIDAAAEDQINPMIEDGELPHLQRVIEEGAFGTMVSEDPSISPRVWTILATGQSPEINGILDFESDRRSLKVGRFWDAAAESGAGVGLMEWHITWPPDLRPGFGVPGWLARGFDTLPTGAAFLKRLERLGKSGDSFLGLQALSDALAAAAVSSADNLWRNLRDGWGVLQHRGSREDTYWRIKLIQARLQTDLYLELMAREQPEVSALVLYPVDALGHAYWRWHEPDQFEHVKEESLALRSEVIKEAYRESDRLLGCVLERVDWGQATLALCSDHGMEAVTRGGHGKTTGRIHAAALARILGVEGSLRSAVAGKRLILSSGLPGEDGVEMLAMVHGALTEAFVTGAPEKRPFELDAFAAESGTVIVDYRPSVLGNLEATLELGGQTVAVKDLFRKEQRSGDHHLDGIVGFLGPGIAQGVTLETSSIYDFAPTVLHLMGLEVPRELAGRVLEDAFQKDWLDAHPVQLTGEALPLPPQVRDVVGDANLMMQNLEEMGYLDKDH